MHHPGNAGYIEPELSNRFVDMWNKHIGKGGGG